MRFTSESVLHEIESALRENKDLDQMLLKAQLHIMSLQRQIDYQELSDEEIIEIANYCSSATAWHGPDLDPIDFARAILKKASER